MLGVYSNIEVSGIYLQEHSRTSRVLEHSSIGCTYTAYTHRVLVCNLRTDTIGQRERHNLDISISIYIYICHRHHLTRPGLTRPGRTMTWNNLRPSLSLSLHPCFLHSPQKSDLTFELRKGETYCQQQIATILQTQ